MERADQEEALPSCVELGVIVTLKLMGSEGNFLSHFSVPIRLEHSAQPAVSSLYSKFRLG